MTEAPHIVRGVQGRCPCGGTVQLGTFADGEAGATHTYPACTKFMELDVTDFAVWLNNVQAMQQGPASIARLELARAGRSN